MERSSQRQNQLSLRKYAKEIKQAKLEEFRGFLDFTAMTFRDKIRHKIDNYVTAMVDGCLPSRLIRMDSSRSSRLDGYVQAFKMLKSMTYRLQSYCYQVWFSCGISACSLDVLGFTPFRLENCLPSGGNVRLRPTRYPCSVAY